MHYLRILITAGIVIGMAVPAYSHREDTLRKEISIEVISENGCTFLIIPHKDFWDGRTHIIKKYLEAKQGLNYGIVIRNMTPDRIGVVIAVDGRNIISGKKSNLQNDEDMYIVNGYGYGQYDGWRTTSDTVHKFYFTDMADSYAMRTFSDSTSMGVIAVAIYREKERPKPVYEQRRLDNVPAGPLTENSTKSKARAEKDERAGTGFGDGKYSPTIRVAFEPEHTPFQKTLIKYEWHEVLCRKGILNCKQEPRNRLWDEDDFAPFPPGYPKN